MHSIAETVEKTSWSGNAQSKVIINRFRTLMAQLAYLAMTWIGQS